MSIYSGFATRAQEQCYDQCIDSLLYVLQRRIIKFYKNEEADEDKFISLVLKLHHQLKSMENNKYLDPKTSQSLNELVKFMQVHQKNSNSDKSKPSEFDIGQPATHQSLPAVEPKSPPEENGPKKKESLWVEKNPIVPTKKDTMVDQQIQTMGIIYDKKDSNSPKQSIVSRAPNRHVISALKTKYGEKISTAKRQRGQELLPPTYGHNLKNRSQSHHLANNDGLSYQHEVKNHLRQIEVIQKKKRRSKLNQRLGIKDLNTEDDISQYEVGDIIKDYVSRIKRKYETADGKHGKETNIRTNDF